MKNLSFLSIFSTFFGIILLVSVPFIGVPLMAIGAGIYFARRASAREQAALEYRDAYHAASVRGEREFILACKSLG